MDTVAIIIGFGGLIAYLEWRVVPLFTVPVDRPATVSHAGPAPTFKCHYCRQSFPANQQERVGGYYYCQEHGHARQQANIAAVKPVVRVTVSQTPIAEPLPWEN